MNMMSPHAPQGSPRPSYRTIFISDTHLGTRGCRADFILESNNNGGGYDDNSRRRDDDDRNRGGRQGAGQTITCSSDDGGRHYCTADTRRGVQLVNQRSGSPCQQGRTWGYDARGIWVDRGCRADFAIR